MRTPMLGGKLDARAELPSHTPGTPRGEELVRRHGREAGRQHPFFGRTARDATSVNASAREPIDPQMPHLPPA
ncbi:MAG: hypothetical protein ACYC61_04855 [Isosphaeraceae bacterium]